MVATHVLPDFGTVTIGRGSDNAIQIDDESISRRHAALHVGRVIMIEDLGSSNGTKLREVAIPPNQRCELGINELVTIGSLTLIIQARFAPAQANRIESHDYFQARLEEECARAERANGHFVVIGIRVEGDASEKAVAGALLTTLRQSDVLAKFDEHSYLLLLVEATRAHGEHVVRRLAASLQLLDMVANCVVAQFPNDGRSAYALMSRISDRVDEPDREGDLVIAEQSMRDLYALAKRIAQSDLSVLILGETGVGKEKMSRAVHELSPRASAPFVAINCAALNDALLETELFGHERGAFTGANTVKPGLLEAAAGGTVFLDEIGDMSLAIQAKLLRVLEDREVRRVGGLKSRKIDVRFIAATNTDLETATMRGRFREDLYFRLSAATLVIPPLRERPHEIELLARRFASHAASRSGGASVNITPEAIGVLRGYSWPGNIRELRNVIERAVLLCGDGSIDVAHLPNERMRGTFIRQAASEVHGDEPQLSTLVDERARILEALDRANGNQGKAASLLGVSRRTLINRLERYDLPRPRKGRVRPAEP